MRIYVTGGTGYIGSVLVRRLVEAGHEVRCLVRPTSRTEDLERLGVACFPGDLTDRASLREGMSGADWVIHAAADLDLGGPPERMAATNVQGSENVASLASKLGVGRFLSVSSMAAFGGSPDDGSAADETSPVRRPFPTRYSATKHAGQAAIERWAEQGLRVNTVYPSLVYGPPGKRGGANGLLRSMLSGRVPALVGADRVTRWIFLDDLVEGMLRVMKRAEPGRSFFFTGDAATVEALARRVCALGGVSPPRFRLSPRMAAVLAAVAEPWFRLRGRRQPVAREHIASLRRHWNFDDARARAELDWTPRDLAAGLPPTVEFLRRSGGRAARREG